MTRFAPAGALVIAVSIAGCTPATPSGFEPDAGGDPGSTLWVDFASRQPTPGDLGGRWVATVDSASVVLRDLRAIGDAGVVSEPRVSVVWGGEFGPASLALEDAPPGIYSELAASIEAMHITGSMEIEDSRVLFEIEDTPPLYVGMRVALHGLEVRTGRDSRVEVTFDFRQIVDAVSWNDVPVGPDGVRRLDARSLQIGAVRGAVDDMFGDDD